jgi:hypothetical protein
MHSPLFPEGKTFFGELPALDAIKKSQNVVFVIPTPESLGKQERERKVARTDALGNLDFQRKFPPIFGKFPYFNNFSAFIMVDVSG